MRDELRITLPLERIDDLFAEPVTSPYSSRYGATSARPGVDHAVAVLLATPARRAVLEVAVEHGELPPPTEVERALHRWARARADDTALDLGRERRVLGLAIASGLCLLGGLLLAAAAVGRIGGDDPTTTVVVSGLRIGAWVSLWFPVQSFLYGMWRSRRQRRMWSTLASARVEVHPRRRAVDRPGLARTAPAGRIAQARRTTVPSGVSSTT